MFSALAFSLGLAVLSADLPPAHTAAPVQNLAVNDLATTYDKLKRAVDDHRYEDALVFAKALTGLPAFANLPPEGRAATHYLVGILSLELGQPTAALRALVLATDGSGSTHQGWRARLQAHVAVRDQNGAARALSVMLGRFPESSTEFSGDFVLQLAGNPDLDRDAAFELRRALLQSGWSHDRDSWIWVKLVDDLIARDRGAEAGPVIARVTTPSSRMQLFAMRRYDAVRPADATYDIDAAYAEALELDRSRAELPGATVGHRNTYVLSLLSRGRFDEALVLTDRILADPLPGADEDPEAESDLTWVMDGRARILLALGRHDEAVEQERAAAVRLEYGQPNVSQTLNLGDILLRLERYSEARDAIASVTEDQVSGPGWMQTMKLRACAAHALSDVTTAAALFARLEADWRENPHATYAALACRGDEDGMAGLLIEMLADQEHQEVGVALTHGYLEYTPVSEFDRHLTERHLRVTARAEVLAARDAVARVYNIPVVDPPI